MLPTHLLERIAPGASPPRAGSYVMYWMRTAVRAEENPALDVALQVAAALGVPVFVVHAVDERYAYASDRHHTFILEGARDVAQALAERGIGYACHVARPGHRGPHLKTLARRACLVVTEDFPWKPVERWTALLEREAPLWRVDTACVVPFRRVGRAYDRAFAFRDATRTELEARIGRPWRDAEPGSPAFLPTLPFEPVDVERCDIPSLVATCAVDHGVGPVHHTRGGSVAGSARWADFLEHGLARYAEERSNPLRPAGASRLSAYLHYGMVSPLRVARDAAAHRTEGAAKFIDELHTWREVTWSFCGFTPMHESVACLPAWARSTLAAHEADARPALPSWETLARGRTADGFWNLLQASLRIHGELHNQVRMTWGKALLGWTPDAAAALALLLDLNHRYALDGRDPGSYGGILWCLGLFDRPHLPERPIVGAVRARPTEVFSQRFDTTEYARRVRRPTRGVVERVAIIGAGVAGCMLARLLMDAGHHVTVFDKGRRPGGRASTRAVEGSTSLTFDHGAPFFTIRDARLRPLVDSWRHDGVVREVEFSVHRARSAGDRGMPAARNVARRLVATPRMSSIVAHLARDLDVQSATAISSIRGSAGAYELTHAGGVVPETFTQIALCMPAPQALPLLEPLAPHLGAVLKTARYAPRIVAMAALRGPLSLGDVTLVDEGPLAFAVRAPGHDPEGELERLVLHGTDAWSRAHQDDDLTCLARELLDALFAATDRAPVEALHLAGHRWRHAVPESPCAGPCLFDADLALGVAGDSFGADGGAEGIESALLSAHALAGRFLALPAAGDASLLRLASAHPPAQLTIW